jgi:tetratricopeptide (TPR) repeat protein
MDYRTDRKMLGMVEGAHFDSDSENLIKPTKTTFGANLDYTLHAYPNHHRALVTLVRLSERERTAQPAGSRYTVDCWFRRAIRFVPDDLIVRMLYANYLGKIGQKEKGLVQLAAVAYQAEDDGAAHYNLGLIYLDWSMFDKALVHAQRAQALGHPFTELQARLEALGRWREAGPPVAAAAAASASAKAASTPGTAAVR